ncbi:SurA N-terminal domain-containing protein [Candidatus Saccharibacteria bacterium]|nr:SurA N-terminal domain-containing protein [Candidatus Saccharibacteria bacterium]
MKKDKKKKAITQQNLEESRDEILSKGKKFRYPFQYSKHRLVIITILISIIAVAAFGFLCWFQLYQAQNTSDVMYRFAKAFGLPVAKIDDVSVKYSDYLMLYRSSIKSIERQQGALDDSEDSKLLDSYYRRQALNSAEEESYALAKLNEMGKPVTDEEIDEVVEEHKTIDGEVRSDQAFEGIVRDNFGLNMTEYGRMIKLSLARKKYSAEIDERAKKLVTEIEAKLQTNSDFAKIAEEYKTNDIFSYETLSEKVDVTSLDSGRAAMAMTIKEVGGISKPFISKSGDGYYIVKLTEREDSRVRYDSIWVRFTEFDDRIQKLREENKIDEYIKLEGGETIEEDKKESAK